MKNEIGKAKKAPLLRRTSPALYSIPFFNFSDPPLPREVIKIYFPPLKKRGGSELQ